MSRGSKRKRDNENSFLDGDIFVSYIRRYEDICKEDRFVPPKKILKELGATESSLVAWRVENHSVFIFGIDPDKIKPLKINEKEGVLILKKIDEKGYLEACPDGDIYVIQVKSQGRVGTKDQISKILKKAGINEHDLIIPQFINNKKEGLGWRLLSLKEKDFIYQLKKKMT